MSQMIILGQEDSEIEIHCERRVSNGSLNVEEYFMGCLILRFADSR